MPPPFKRTEIWITFWRLHRLSDDETLSFASLQYGGLIFHQAPCSSEIGCAIQPDNPASVSLPASTQCIRRSLGAFAT